MKDILENKATFEAYSTIDFCYFQIKELHLDRGNPTSGIGAMIDKATGYDKAQSEEYRGTIIELLKEIIEAKKVINANFSGDLELLNQVKSLRN